ncbi:hypothetical protein Tco_0403670 [Tanacetum coccineum]
MKTIGTTMQQVHVNTKFLNALQLEWSKFVTDVKLAKKMYTTNFNQLYAYLSQHVFCVIDIRIHLLWFPTIKLSTILLSLHNSYHQLLNKNYSSLAMSQQPQATFPQPDSGLIVPTFLPGDDPIACLNKAMAFISTIGGLLFSKFKEDKGEGNMARQCTQPKRTKNSTWFKEKMLLVQAQESGQVLDEEQLAFLAYPGVADDQASQTTIKHNAIFLIDDLDAYDSDCDDVSSAKAVLMANGSNNEITIDSNIIPYSQYLQETQNVIVQDTNSSTPQDVLIMSMFEQMYNEVTNWDKANQVNKTINESLTAELERYKEQNSSYLGLRKKYRLSLKNDMPPRDKANPADIFTFVIEITSINVNGKNAYELKGKFLDDLYNNAFSGTNGEVAVKHIEYFLRIVDPIDLPNVNQDKLRVLVFPISLVDPELFTYDRNEKENYNDYMNGIQSMSLKKALVEVGVHYEIWGSYLRTFMFKNGENQMAPLAVQMKMVLQLCVRDKSKIHKKDIKNHELRKATWNQEELPKEPKIQSRGKKSQAPNSQNHFLNAYVLL